MPSSPTPLRSSSSISTSSSWPSASTQTSIHEQTPPIIRVAIVGGGLGGLTLAQILHCAPNVQVTVYERSIDEIERLSGYRVMLSSFVLKKLQATLHKDVWDRVAASIGVQPQCGQELTFFKSDGRKMLAFEADEIRDTYSVNRWLLRNALLYGSHDFAIFGKTFQAYENLPNGGMMVHFNDGSRVECDLLVGADGIGSRVRKQLVPDARITEPWLAIIYFKIPLTPVTENLLLTQSMTRAFCHRNQNIFIHSWTNPRKHWATLYDEYDIGMDESFIMFGYGSPCDEFSNKSKPPGELSSEELKVECLERVRADPKMHPSFIALAEQLIINTAHIHIVRDCKAIKRWNSGSVTLIGDSVFSISTVLGKGANCAMLDAIDLAEALQLPQIFNPSIRSHELQQAGARNVKRRLKERQRGALIQNIIYSGNNKMKELCRDLGLKLAFEWIDDPRATNFHSGKKRCPEKVERS
ncbi:FAD protein [Venustampulla echinocandica]|uniref:FAD protein n=1 Tax=Venustampulla echinocandica TaxID=2656787 RepID=A0A370TH13_9HELO|nr:FAD protein [Venustampulla echinocandica]RDL34494.1 FAD protein [Venustampulla echinocandica]